MSNMLSHYMKAVLGGIVMALVVTGLNVLVNVLFNWLQGDPIGQLLSIKHLFLFEIVLLLSTGYLSTRQPDKS